MIGMNMVMMVLMDSNLDDDGNGDGDAYMDDNDKDDKNDDGLSRISLEVSN